MIDLLSRMISYYKLKNYQCHFGEDDILMEDIVLNPVHILPKGRWEVDQEIDFYMKDNYNIYLLRIISNDDYTVTLCSDSPIRYIIVCVPMENTYSALKKIISELKKIPYTKKIRHSEETYRFMI